MGSDSTFLVLEWFDREVHDEWEMETRQQLEALAKGVPGPSSGDVHPGYYHSASPGPKQF
jgi:hypothetical protein